MTFLSALFLPGLALAAVPVLIHLFSRRRRQTVPWGAMQFLADHPPRRRRNFLRLTELLVLLLRVLAIVALVGAFARPQLPSRVAGRVATVTTLVLDASLSTARWVGAETSALQAEVAAARRVLDGLGDGDTVRVLLATDAPRWLTPTPLAIDDANRAALRTMLSTVTPTLEGSDLPLAITEALSLAPAPGQGRHRIVLLSDETERPWRGSEAARWAALARAVQTAPLPTALLAVRALDAPDPATLDNLSLQQFTLAQETIAAGEEAQLTAVIQNHAQRSSRATELIWELDGREVARRPLPPIDPGATGTFEFALRCEATGSHLAGCRIAGEDDLPLDDADARAISVPERLPILVVDGARDADAKSVAETEFLLAATKTRTPLEPQLIAPAALKALELAPFVGVVLADVAAIERETAQRLAAQVATGTGLWIVLGERADAENFNSVFGPAGLGLSPVGLGAVRRQPPENAAGLRILPPPRPHPATLLLGDSKSLDLDKARLHANRELLEPLPPDLDVLLAAETQAPLLLEHPFGSGRVFVQTFPLNRAWSNLPILHAYVPLVRETLWHLAAGRLSRRNLPPGASIRLPAASGDVEFRVHLPGGRVVAVSGARIFSQTFEPGVYRVESGHGPADIFTVQRDAAESQLAPLRAETRALLGAHGVQFASDAGEMERVSAATVPPQISLAPHLLWLALALFALEALFALVFGRQRRVRPKPAPVAHEAPALRV